MPIFSWALFFKDNSTGLQECLGRGYNNFLSTKPEYCSYDNSFLNIFCWTWLCLIITCMSNIVDAYLTFCCAKHINKSTEESKRMLSKEAYINRKRYWWIKISQESRDLILLDLTIRKVEIFIFKECECQKNSSKAIAEFWLKKLFQKQIGSFSYSYSCKPTMACDHP